MAVTTAMNKTAGNIFFNIVVYVFNTVKLESVANHYKESSSIAIEIARGKLRNILSCIETHLLITTCFEIGFIEYIAYVEAKVQVVLAKFVGIPTKKVYGISIRKFLLINNLVIKNTVINTG